MNKTIKRIEVYWEDDPVKPERRCCCVGTCIKGHQYLKEFHGISSLHDVIRETCLSLDMDLSPDDFTGIKYVDRKVLPGYWYLMAIWQRPVETEKPKGVAIGSLYNGNVVDYQDCLWRIVGVTEPGTKVNVMVNGAFTKVMAVDLTYISTLDGDKTDIVFNTCLVTLIEDIGEINNEIL